MASPTANIPRKPQSNLFKGYYLRESRLSLSTINDAHVLRDNFTISTWLLIGACLQCLLLALPIRPSYALLPAFVLLGYRFINGLLMCFGIIKHPYADGAVYKKTGIVMPESYSVDGKKKDDGGICVIMLFARCNSPLGVLSPHYRGLADRMRSLIYDLDTHAPTNGFLGGESMVNSCARTTGSEVITMAYFKSHEDLQAFAHGKHHREIWDWWNKLMTEKKASHISIAHEVYCAPKGSWEGVYVNQVPSMLESTSHWVVDKEGKGAWQNPTVLAKGRLRSAMGRMEKSIGDDNEKYGGEPYEQV